MDLRLIPRLDSVHLKQSMAARSAKRSISAILRKIGHLNRQAKFRILFTLTIPMTSSILLKSGISLLTKINSGSRKTCEINWVFPNDSKGVLIFTFRSSYFFHRFDFKIMYVVSKEYLVYPNTKWSVSSSKNPDTESYNCRQLEKGGVAMFSFKPSWWCKHTGKYIFTNDKCNI